MTALLTAGAMAAFASNSLLCRAALAEGSIDAVSFTSIRLLSGALMLLALVRGKGGGGGWVAAAALAAYAFAFSIAYLRLSAGTGALILFGTVQATLILWGLARGERPRVPEWLGLAMALGGLVVLTLPGLTAPDPMGAALMAASGIAWGVYTARGKGAADPLAANAGNFARSVTFAAIAAVATTASGERFHFTRPAPASRSPPAPSPPVSDTCSGTPRSAGFPGCRPPSSRSPSRRLRRSAESRFSANDRPRA